MTPTDTITVIAAVFVGAFLLFAIAASAPKRKDDQMSDGWARRNRRAK